MGLLLHQASAYMALAGLLLPAVLYEGLEQLSQPHQPELAHRLQVRLRVRPPQVRHPVLCTLCLPVLSASLLYSLQARPFLPANEEHFATARVGKRGGGP